MKIRYAILALLTGMAFGQGQFSGGGGSGSSPGSACGDSSHALSWTGSAYGCQAITGSAAAGGSTTQVQFNNGGALGGISQWTTNGTTTLTGSATSVLDLHLAGTGGFLFPGALASGIVKVTTGTGAITIATAPTGAIVGTTDTQVLTNKDLTGAGNTFPTFNQNTTGSAASFTGNLAGDVTGAQGATVVGKINGVSLAGLATGILKNTTTTGVPSIAIAADFPTLNQNTTGTAAALTSTPTNCGAGVAAIGILANGNATGCFTPGGLSNPMTTLGDVIYGGASGTATRLAGPTATNGVVQVLTETPSGGAAVAPSWSPLGVVTNAQTGTSYTIAATDRAGYVSFSNASAIAVTLPAANGAGFASNFPFVTCDIGAGTATITPTTSTISYANGSAYTSAASTLPLTTGQCAWIYSDNTNYFAILHSGGGGGSGLSGMTTGQVPIAATATTITSSKILAGSGTGITTGPTSSTTTDLASFTGTGGQLQDSGIASASVNTTAAVANPPLDKSGTGLSNPTADGTFTYPIGSTTGFTLAGTAPASVSTSTGTNATSLFNVNGVTGGADSNATGTAGTGSSPLLTAGNGGAGTGTNTIGGTGGSLTVTAGNGGVSLGTGANSNGGGVSIALGQPGTGGSGTAGKTGIFQTTDSGGHAGFNGCTQGTAVTTSNANIPANSMFTQCPTAVTAYSLTVPGAQATNNNSAMVFTNAGVGSFAKMPQALFLTSLYTNATTTFSNVTGLSFSAEASTNYTVECNLDYQASATTADVKIQWTGPASPTFLVYDMISEVTASTLSSSVNPATATTTGAFSTALSEAGTPTTATNFPLKLSMTLINGANAGTVQLQAAAVGTGTVSILPGSCQVQ